MVGILNSMRITECVAFIAGPFATMSLASLGAEIIRIDPIGGGIDYTRWPVTRQGRSLYWAGLNKGKKSVRIDLSLPEGRVLAQRIVTAPGDAGGLFVSNLPAKGWMAYDALKAERQDLIMVSVVGSRDGSTAIDYTVNSAVGFPMATGPSAWTQPVNHVLPAWDFLCGMTAATALLAAERYRRDKGVGQLLRIALSDSALAVVGDLGLLAEVQLNGEGRGRYGNDIYGAFGRDFETADGRRLMVAAVSTGQWVALCKATGIEAQISAYEQAQNIDFRTDTKRFEEREAISTILAPWFRSKTLAEIRTVLDKNRVCWGPYQTFDQLVAEDPRCSTENPLFENVEHPGIGTTLTPRSPIDVGEGGQMPAGIAPLLGQHTDEVLLDVLKLSSAELGRLHDNKVVAGIVT